MYETKKICHIYQKNTDISENKINSYAIENFCGFGSVQKAADITKNIFLDQWNREYIRKMTYKGYELSWSFYSLVNNYFSLPFTEIEKLTEIVKNYDTIILHNCEEKYARVLKHICYNKNFQNKNKTKNDFKKKTGGIRRFFSNFMALCVTILALFYFSVSKKKVGIWTGATDKIFPGTDCDFRLVRLYQNLRKNKIKFAEFVANESLKKIFKNILLRKRLIIYYPPIGYFLSFFVYPKKIKPQSAHNSVLLSYDSNNRLLLKTVPIFELIYKLIGIKSLWIRAFGHSNAELVIAAKSAGIKTVGMMHGLNMRTYVVNEFMPAYNSSKKMGADVFGVWSPWLEQELKKHGRIMASESIKYAGLLRPYILEPKISEEKKKETDKIRVFLISEPMVNPEEIIPYLKPLMEDKRFSLAIKLHPALPDRFYNRLIKIFPKAKSLPIYKGNIFEDGKNADIFIGSHSTALLEASLMDKLSIFLKTQKWGDYLEIKDWLPEVKMLVEKPEKIVENILTRVKKENKFKTIEKIKFRFFGENKDGTIWAVKELDV
jgi:hypothetical protein